MNPKKYFVEPISYQHHAINFNRDGLSDEQLLRLYDQLLLPRMIEEKMLVLLRQGKISKWFAGIGQEGVAIGATAALQPDEYILPMHRNLGVFTTREVPLAKLFMQWQGKADGFTKGRDRSFHFGTNDYHIAGMISHLGPQLAVADGIALAEKLQSSGRCALVFSGDGGTSEGDFHEALNVAAVWQLPVLFVIENNGYGLSTPVQEQFRCAKLSDRAVGYGMEGVTIDGNNVLEVYKTIDHFAREVRANPRPILVECMTFRMRGHEEASGTKYVPEELMRNWAAKDPVVQYEMYLREMGVLTEDYIEAQQASNKAAINTALQEAFAAEPPVATVAAELADVYKPYSAKPIVAGAATSEKRFVDAISDGLRQSMAQWDNLLLMGQDIAEYGGVFKITDGFVQQFGKDRVRNTPLCESAILGAALGLSIRGYKSMVEMQFADFVSTGFNQIVNNLAKAHYRWGQAADVVIRMPTGAGVGAGPYHSQSNEAWFFHTPGLKIVYPATPEDAKGLLAAAIADPNPVLFFEHKQLYRSLVAPVPDDFYTVPIGEARQVSKGEDLSIITYGAGVHWAMQAAAKFPDYGFDIVDMRSLLPYDKATMLASVEQTGKVIVLHEDTITGGIGSEWASVIAEEAFTWLDGPVIRVGALDTPVPFAQPLEAQFLPQQRLMEAIETLLAY